MDIPRRGFLRGRRGAQRVGKRRRTARSLIQAGRRRGGRNVRGERARDIIREGARGIFRRNR